MQISRASEAEYPEVRQFYHSLIDAMQDTPFHPMWKKDIYPSQEDLRSAIGEGSLFIGRSGGQIAAASDLQC